jgi:hypothetical protein
MFTDLTATRTPQGIRVRWDTRELPFDHQGFLVYREGFDGERERLTATRREGTSGQFLDDDAPPGAAIYWIAGEAATGRIVWYRSVTVSQAPGLRLTLSPNSPNPFPASGTTLAFVNGVEGRVTLTVFDVSGRIVNRLMDRTLPPGGYDVFWDGRDTAGHGVSSGVYFYRLAGPEGILTRRMIRVP